MTNKVKTQLLILIGFILSTIIYMYIFNGEYTLVNRLLVFLPVIIFRLIIYYDTISRLKRYNQLKPKYKNIGILGVIISICSLGFILLIPPKQESFYISFNVIVDFERAFLEILSIVSFLGGLWIDNKLSSWCKKTIKCCDFEYKSHCYKKSCINCNFRKESKIAMNEAITIELTKQNSFYKKALCKDYKNISMYRYNKENFNTFKTTLQLKYINESFEDLDFVK